MQPSTISALLEAYDALQKIVIKLYDKAQLALDANLHNDASLLISQADLFFQVAENLDTLISEQEDLNNG